MKIDIPHNDGACSCHARLSQVSVKFKYSVLIFRKHNDMMKHTIIYEFMKGIHGTGR